MMGEQARTHETPRYGAEQAVIAALLSRPESYFELGGRLIPEMFVGEGERLVFKSVTTLAAKGERMDMVTIERGMVTLDNALYDRLGGISFLRDALAAVRNDSHILTHARLVQEDWVLRGCRDLLRKHGLEAETPGVEVTALMKGLRDGMDRLELSLAADKETRSAGEVAREALGRSYREQRERQEGRFAEIRTGIRSFDELTGGLHPGDLTVLAARPSMGKTAVALWWALQSARQGRRTVFFSVEMSERELVHRLLAMLSGVSAEKIRFRGTSEAERVLLDKAAAELEAIPLRIVYCGSLTIDEIRAMAMREKSRQGLDLMLIDYLNLIHTPETRYGQRNETTDLTLGELVRKLKLMAVEMNVPAVLLAQMNRDSDRRQAPFLPVLSDLRNSGAIEQVADQVVFVYRPEKYGILVDPKTKEDLRGVGYLLVAKNRLGATGKAPFRYNPEMTRFMDYDNRLI